MCAVFKGVQVKIANKKKFYQSYNSIIFLHSTKIAFRRTAQKINKILKIYVIEEIQLSFDYNN